MEQDILERPQNPRLERLLGFLQSDPGNRALLADAASTAFDDRAFDLSAELLGRRAALGPLPPPLTNLAGLLALAQQRFDDAVAIFEGLHRAGADDPALRFNLAWSLAMTKSYDAALALLDEATVAASPRAPALRIHLLHHLDRYDEALAEGEALAARHTDNQELMGALATLAMDAEKPELSLAYARRAGDDAEGQAALGMLELGAYDSATALQSFDKAIARAPANPRAWVGKGLGLLAGGDVAGGADAIDRGASLFGDHIGSWIAAGWAQFAKGDMAGARARFERALAIDDTFAESHGGLAVMDILDGRLEEARRRADIALRLDRKCFGGALARSMLLQQAGNPQMAQKVRDLALNTPIAPGGPTILQAMTGFGISPRRK